MDATRSVMIFVEQLDGVFAEVGLELLCEGRRLATKLGVPVEAVVLGHKLGSQLADLGNYGCDCVYYVEDERLARFTSVPYAKAITQVIRNHGPQIVLFGATTTGRDVAPRVASELKCGLTADCTKLEIGDYTSKDKTWKNILMQIRPAFGGNIIATIVSPESVPSMATVREGVMRLDLPDRTKAAKVVKEDFVFKVTDFPSEIIEVIKTERSVNLKNSNIIVSAGMGASDPETLKILKEFARTIGGVVGASRPVVDAGLLHKDHQVGQTGTTVRPNLYIACGISGQIQHRAGMAESKRIIAINTDSSAPIFAVAHYGIVGDVGEVLARMTKAYKEKSVE
jgi:electron transfer flavoprotein alpha subunit